MKKNLSAILLIILAILALYLTKKTYGGHSLQKSISACIIAQVKKNENLTYEVAKNYCEKEIKKN
jgi:cell division protein FtsL